jgi:hypothetical protein
VQGEGKKTLNLPSEDEYSFEIVGDGLGAEVAGGCCCAMLKVVQAKKVSAIKCV